MPGEPPTPGVYGVSPQRGDLVPGELIIAEHAVLATRIGTHPRSPMSWPSLPSWGSGWMS